MQAARKCHAMIESTYDSALCVPAQPGDRWVLVLGGITQIDPADLIAPNRFAKNLRERLRLVLPHIRQLVSLKWSRGWPGTEGPWCVKLEVQLVKPPSEVEPNTAKALAVTDLLLVDKLGVRAFSISELGELYLRKPRATGLADSGTPVHPEVREWLVSGHHG